MNELNQETINPNAIYTSPEAARLLRLAQQTITRAAKKGLLVGQKMGGSGYRFSGQSLLNFINHKYESKNQNS